MALVRQEIREHLDSPHLSPGELALNLRDLRALNTLFGGHRYAVGHVARLARRLPRGSPIAVLDAGVGGGDVALALVAWGRRTGYRVAVRGLDISPVVAAYARRAVAREPAITIEHGDALALEAAEQSFDVCLSTLTLHHLSAAHGAELLRRFDRLARLGFAVVDLVRTRAAYLAVWLASRALSRTTRHDAPASVLRSYTVPELRALVAESGVRGVRVVRHPLFRVALVKEQPQ